MSGQPTPSAPTPADVAASSKPADPAVTTGTPAGDKPADVTPPAPPAADTPDETPSEAAGLCEICFPDGLPEGYTSAGCEHSA